MKKVISMVFLFLLAGFVVTLPACTHWGYWGPHGFGHGHGYAHDYHGQAHYQDSGYQGY